MRTVVPTPWTGAEPPALEPGGVHVWSLSLAGEADLDVLADAERERVERFAQEQLGTRWSRARGGLRRILAAYAGAAPAGIALEQAPCVHCGEQHGKPFLARPAAGWLRFNLSHSNDLGVVAVAHGREVGVDVEATREGRRLQGIAESWFSEAEAEELRRLEGAERQELFYRLWARKESYLKATAEGIAGSLAAFEALDPSARDDLPGWDFADLDMGAGYAGALALAPESFRPATAPAGGARRSR